MALAKEFGRLDVDQMLSEIDSVQFAEWLAFLNMDPAELEEKRRDVETFESLMAAQYGGNR